MGTAFAAVADDPSAMAVNPAGLTQIRGTYIYGGTTFLITSTTFTSPSGQSEETEFQVFFPPHLYISSDFNTKDLRLGLGIFSSFGIGGRKWDETGITRYISTESSIATINVNPTIAYRLSPSLSVGLGVDYMLSLNQVERMVDQSAAGAGDGEFRMKGFGDGWGFNVGILFAPEDKWSFGLAYRSKIKVDHRGEMELKNIAPALQPLFGGAAFKTDFRAPMTAPDIITFGIAYRPQKKLTLALDLERVRCSSLDNWDLNLEKEIPDANFTDISVPLDWKDVWWIKLGMDYKLSEKLSLRGGYAFIESPVPDHTLDPSCPDSDQHNFSIGLGINRGSMIFDFFYTADFYVNRSVNNDILSGKYENFTHFAGFSIGRKFR